MHTKARLNSNLHFGSLGEPKSVRRSFRPTHVARCSPGSSAMEYQKLPTCCQACLGLQASPFKHHGFVSNRERVDEERIDEDSLARASRLQHRHSGQAVHALLDPTPCDASTFLRPDLHQCPATSSNVPVSGHSVAACQATAMELLLGSLSLPYCG